VIAVKLVSWRALIVAGIYAAVVSAILMNAEKTGDAEELTATWIVFGFPGWLFGGKWRAIAFNVGLVYCIFAYLIPALIRSYRKYSRPPE
jgi:hypothetical protein